MENKIFIRQKNYSLLEIDNSEKDVVLIWGVDPLKIESNVVFFEREKLTEIIETLQKINNENKRTKAGDSE